MSNIMFLSALAGITTVDAGKSQDCVYFNFENCADGQEKCHYVMKKYQSKESSGIRVSGRKTKIYKPVFHGPFKGNFKSGYGHPYKQNDVKCESIQEGKPAYDWKDQKRFYGIVANNWDDESGLGLGNTSRDRGWQYSSTGGLILTKRKTACIYKTRGERKVCAQDVNEDQESPADFFKDVERQSKLPELRKTMSSEMCSTDSRQSEVDAQTVAGKMEELFGSKKFPDADRKYDETIISKAFDYCQQQGNSPNEDVLEAAGYRKCNQRTLHWNFSYTPESSRRSRDRWYHEDDLFITICVDGTEQSEAPDADKMEELFGSKKLPGNDGSYDDTFIGKALHFCEDRAKKKVRIFGLPSYTPRDDVLQAAGYRKCDTDSTDLERKISYEIDDRAGKARWYHEDDDRLPAAVQPIEFYSEEEYDRLNNIIDGLEDVQGHPFQCVISGELMKNPVKTPYGHTFEKSSIEEWVRTNQTCPNTKGKLTLNDLVPDHALRQDIENWRDAPKDQQPQKAKDLQKTIDARFQEERKEAARQKSREDAKYNELAKQTGSEADGFICPITKSLMNDPVQLTDNTTYERSALEEWLKKNSTHPVTKQQLPYKNFFPNDDLKAQIEQWRKKNRAKVAKLLSAEDQGTQQ